MNKVKKYTKRFIEDESGMEFVQFVIILVIVVMLIPFLMKLFEVIKNKIEDATTQVDNIDLEKGLNGNGN